MTTLVKDKMALEAGNGRNKVKVKIFEIGTDGLLVILGGGEKPHIGTVILCEPRPDGWGCTTSVLNVMAHRDEEVARSLAERICMKNGRIVVCIAGIHVDNATKRDIESIIKNCEELRKKI